MPVSTGPLHTILGHLVDTYGANSILDGSYQYPTHADSHTALLFQEMADCYDKQKHSPRQTDGRVSVVDFLDYWRTANEKTSSSLSGWHFGHYEVASFLDILTHLHVSSVNLAVSRGQVTSFPVAQATALTLWQRKTHVYA